jgi:ABC-type uncharacterized transport system ATPase subunit
MSSLSTKTTRIAINNGYITYQQNDKNYNTNSKISNVPKTRNIIITCYMSEELKNCSNILGGKATSKTNCSLKKLLERHSETIKLRTLYSYKLISLHW